MAHRRIIESEEFSDRIDTSLWPIVLTDNFSSELKEIYEKRKLAVDLYLKNLSNNEILELTGIHRNHLSKFIKRCLDFDENGVIWGYRALIPHKHLKSYKSTNTPDTDPHSHTPPSMNGAFQFLLACYPELKTLIENLYFKQSSRSASDPIIRGKEIHRKFIKKCTELGIKSPTQYPFNTVELARRSLYEYLKKLNYAHFEKASERYGEDAALIANTTGQGSVIKKIIRPFEQVQFDGHRLDVIIALVLYTPEGDEIVTIIDRIWLLAIIDVGSKAVLGHYVSYNKEYTPSDVLKCIRNAIIPWKPKKFTIPNLKYPEQGGFPSGVIEKAQWALWNELLYDQAKANLAEIVKDRLKQTVRCTVNSGRIKSPVKRSHIERLFGLIEQNGIQRLPTTTGSHPEDPKRRNPEKQAVKYRVSAEHIEELVEVLFAEYNGTRSEGINFSTPLEAMLNRLKRYEVNQMPEEQRSNLNFLSLKATREVQGSIKKGRRPYIQYENARYTNDILARSSGLIGKKLGLLVNIDDLRVIEAFLPDGSELGKLRASGRWGITPHSLQVRREIYALKRQKLLDFTASDDPIEIYQKYLESTLKTRKTNRNKYLELTRKNSESEGNDNIEIIHEETLQEKVNEEIIELAQVKRRTEEVSKVEVPKPNKIRRTIVF
ncbi:hypothetical protein HZF08_22525 [Paenibacillus sp. CGMCC 1.16610]|uniref:Integrase catalytic domain-containing protein n=1 Tax=Paenibacillus anseongense TaxID=2682845 RepID=A0ABW9UI90_9BACL|nr:MULTISPECIES: hypothetical protein [Paenibacillus]MBA2941059.1 hypothetical protein [Paenibacillus sp. CGMCC 1.16610]MVQ39879.1 hypothetical protein [Paenibacillus anseongense]